MKLGPGKLPENLSEGHQITKFMYYHPSDFANFGGVLLAATRIYMAITNIIFGSVSPVHMVLVLAYLYGVM